MYGRTHPVEGPLEWIDLRVEGIPDRWYNVIPDLPRAPDELIDGRTGQPLSQEYLERMLPRALAAQERAQATAEQTAKLLQLMDQNTKLTELTKELSQHIELLTTELHSRVCKGTT